ncbi:MAG: metallophosphoesterase [Halioglobus sp.]|nr:metallophosphoesterase [Halioglobus sp.]
MRKRQQFLLVALLLHIPLFAYPILRLCDWLGLDGWTTTAIFVPLFFSQIVARLYLRHANFGLVFWLRRGADLWLGISPLLLCMLLAAEIPVAMGWIAASSAAWTLLAITALLMAYSVANAYSPSVVAVPLRSDKLDTPLRFAQITDVHIGSRSGRFLDRVIQQVNRLDIAFLCITGDFIDAPGVSEDTLSALRNCRVPIYFSIGNHERYEDLDEILQRLANLGVQVLRSQSVVHGPVQLIGIDDSEHPAKVERELAAIDVDPQRFVLLLYHRPRGLAAAAAAGVDLMICGHTHNGQIVPFNLVVARVFEQTVGLFRCQQTQLYVSPGTGTWGPVMRLGSRGEITLFDVAPTAARTGNTRAGIL